MLNPIPSGLLESIKQAMTVHRLPTGFHCILLFCQILFALRPLLNSVLGSTLYHSLTNIPDHIVGSAQSTARLLTEKGARLIVCGLPVYIPFLLESSLSYDLSMRTLWLFCWMSLRASEHPLHSFNNNLSMVRAVRWRDPEDNFAKTFA